MGKTVCATTSVVNGIGITVGSDTKVVIKKADYEECAYDEYLYLYDLPCANYVLIKAHEDDPTWEEFIPESGTVWCEATPYPEVMGKMIDPTVHTAGDDFDGPVYLNTKVVSFYISHEAYNTKCSYQPNIRGAGDCLYMRFLQYQLEAIIRYGYVDGQGNHYEEGMPITIPGAYLGGVFDNAKEAQNGLGPFEPWDDWYPDISSSGVVTFTTDEERDRRPLKEGAYLRSEIKIIDSIGGDYGLMPTYTQQYLESQGILDGSAVKSGKFVNIRLSLKSTPMSYDYTRTVGCHCECNCAGEE